MTARSKVPRLQDARERLRRVAEGTASAATLSPARARALMDERARRLAAPPARPADGAQMLEVLGFALGEECYGVETRQVREVVGLGEVTPVPSTPDFLLGVVNLRGQLLPVLDVGGLVGLPAREASPRSRVVVLGAERPELGVLADAVHEVTTVPVRDVLEAAASHGGAAARYVRGVTRDALVLIDAARLLDDERLFDSDQQAGREPATRGVE